MREVVQSIHSEIRGAWRFRWVAMIVAWLVCIVGWCVVFLLPDQYQAEARFYVSAETPLRNAMEKMINTADDLTEISLVRAEMLSRPMLEEVARTTDLDLRAGTPQEKEALIEKLRQTVRIDSTASSRGRRNRGGDDGVYLISYRDHERLKAVAVVDSLLETFKKRITVGSVDGTNSSILFFEGQVENYENQLRQREQALEQFKRENFGLLPGDGGSYFERRQAEEEELGLLEGQLQVVLDQRTALNRQYRGEGSRTPRTDVADLREQITALEKGLSDLLLLYTDQHPDVVARRAQLEELKRRLADDEPVGTGGVNCATMPDNPVCQDLSIRLNEIDVQASTLESQIRAQRAKVEQLGTMIERIPEVEARLVDLQRDYGQVQGVYEELRRKLEQARLSAGVSEWSGANFRVLDPPRSGSEPVAPNRPLLLVMVMVAGLGAGAAIAFLIHLLRPVFADARSLMDATGLPVLGTVSMTWLSRHRKERLVEAGSLAAVALTLVIALVIVLVFQDAGVEAAAKVKRMALL